jgi:hypothetical protein
MDNQTQADALAVFTGCLEPQRLTSYRNRGIKTRRCLGPDYAKHVVEGVRPEAAISASLFAVILFGVPFCRPPQSKGAFSTLVSRFTGLGHPH